MKPSPGVAFCLPLAVGPTSGCCSSRISMRASSFRLSKATLFSVGPRLSRKPFGNLRLDDRRFRFFTSTLGELPSELSEFPAVVVTVLVVGALAALASAPVRVVCSVIDLDCSFSVGFLLGEERQTGQLACKFNCFRPRAPIHTPAVCD